MPAPVFRGPSKHFDLQNTPLLIMINDMMYYQSYLVITILSLSIFKWILVELCLDLDMAIYFCVKYILKPLMKSKNRFCKKLCEILFNYLVPYGGAGDLIRKTITTFHIPTERIVNVSHLKSVTPKWILFLPFAFPIYIITVVQLFLPYYLIPMLTYTKAYEI